MILRWAWLPSVMLFACDNTPPEHTEAPADQRASQASPQTASDEHPPPRSTATPDATPSGPPLVAIDVTLIEVRTQDDVVEIEIELPRPLPPTGAIRPSLHIGEEVTQRSRAGRTGRLDRLIFTVPAAQYARMSQSADIVVRAGLFTNEASHTKPHLAEAK